MHKMKRVRSGVVFRRTNNTILILLTGKSVRNLGPLDFCGVKEIPFLLNHFSESSPGLFLAGKAGILKS